VREESDPGLSPTPLPLVVVYMEKYYGEILGSSWRHHHSQSMTGLVPVLQREPPGRRQRKENFGK